MEHHNRNNKGGRPKLKVKRNERISVRCSLLEAKIILNKAKRVNLSKSEFMRESALRSKVVSKTFPKDILQFKAEINHLASNMNQIAKSANQKNYLNKEEIIQLNTILVDLKIISNKILN